MTRKRSLLVDGNSVAFRASFVLHSSLKRFKNKNGLHANAIYAFNNMFENVMQKEMPAHVLVTLDTGETTFGAGFYSEYKAGRSKTPDEFKEQMPYIRELLESLGVKYYELPNYEADGITGILADKVDKGEYDAVVLLGNRDLTQSATDTIKVDITVRGVSDIESYTPEHTAEKYDGLTPKQIIDMKGLTGDTSDSIPDVTKIGEKTAIKLLKQYGSAEGVYENIDEMKKGKIKENLIDDRERAFLSRRLTTIEVSTPAEVSVEDSAYEGKSLEKLVPFHKEMDSRRFLAKLDVTGGPVETEDILFGVVGDQLANRVFTDDVTLRVEMMEDNCYTSPIVGPAWGNGRKVYTTNNLAVFESQPFIDWLMDETRKKNIYNTKRTHVALNRYVGKMTEIAFDALLVVYLFGTDDNNVDIEGVAQHYGYDAIQFDEAIYGKGAKKGLSEGGEVFPGHLARRIRAIQFLTNKLDSELAEKNQADLFCKMELPLSRILDDMGITGIRVNAMRLEEIQVEFSKRLKEIEEKVYAEAGKGSNLNSPKQLGVILFEKMGLPVIKKTKTGYSAAVDVLEQLKGQAPIVADILTYRQITKIQLTYVEGLLKVIQLDNKIHTRYVQTLTQAGRLSSIDPNLQDIPIHLEEGQKIREAFASREDNWLISSSDYPQVESCVLAHISNDEHLKEAFVEGQGIHAGTAVRVSGAGKAEDVAPSVRRQAKAVNFGIVYGISDYGLSQDLGITRKQAQQYIDTYSEKYPGVKQYMEEVVRGAKDKGYVETLYHCRHYLSDINPRNFSLRLFAERATTNTPIQGSTADILKIAMIEMVRRLKEEKLQATMLLQVYDELVFEVPESELEQLNQLVKEVIEHAVSLCVPLIADSSQGRIWYEAE